MINFQNISKSYCPSDGKQVYALSDISFRVAPGEFVSIIGESGAGKTTLIKLLIGEEKPSQGQVFFNGLDVSRVRPDALQKIRRKIGVVHQDYKLLCGQTVKENLKYVLQVLNVSDESIERDVPKVLKIIGLAERVCNLPKELSGGEQQRLAIGRALIHRPLLLIADEPTGNLDIRNTQQIVDLLQKINDMGTTVLVTTHDERIINNLNKRVITLHQGNLISDKIEES